MGCAKSKPQVAPKQPPVLDAVVAEQVKSAEAEWRAAAQGKWNLDATLDPTTPLKASHFREQGRLALLVLHAAPAGGRSTARH